MIIGKNTNIQQKNNFVSHNTIPKENQKKSTSINQMSQHPNIMNKNEMNDRAFSLLQDRLDKGLISLEEFNKMCSKLGKTK